MASKNISSALRRATVPLLILIVMGAFAILSPAFLTLSNMFNILRQVAILGIISAGLTPIVLTGEVDISVGSAVSFISCCVSLLIVKAGINPVVACLIGIVAAIAILVVNCLIVTATGMPSMLESLAAMQIYSGLAYLITKATPVSGLPESMRMVGQGYLGPVPIPVIIVIVVFIVMAFILGRTKLGREIYAVGSNREAARLSGIPVRRVLFATFGMCGALVGLAACVQTSRLFCGSPQAGVGLEMEALTAVVVGGVSFSGGSGKVGSVLFGVILMGVLNNGLSIIGLSSYSQDIVTGAVLLLVVGLDCWQRLHARDKQAA
jgi:ribose transport system permease protein